MSFQLQVSLLYLDFNKSINGHQKRRKKVATQTEALCGRNGGEFGQGSDITGHYSELPYCKSSRLPASTLSQEISIFYRLLTIPKEYSLFQKDSTPTEVAQSWIQVETLVYLQLQIRDKERGTTWAGKQPPLQIVWTNKSDLKLLNSRSKGSRLWVLFPFNTQSSCNPLLPHGSSTLTVFLFKHRGHVCILKQNVPEINTFLCVRFHRSQTAL